MPVALSQKYCFILVYQLKKKSLKQDHGRAIRSAKISSQTFHCCHVWPQEIRTMSTDGMIPSIGFALRQICQRWLLKARKRRHGQIMTSARLIFVAAPRSQCLGGSLLSKRYVVQQTLWNITREIEISKRRWTSLNTSGQCPVGKITSRELFRGKNQFWRPSLPTACRSVQPCEILTFRLFE